GRASRARWLRPSCSSLARIPLTCPGKCCTPTAGRSSTDDFTPWGPMVGCRRPRGGERMTSWRFAAAAVLAAGASTAATAQSPDAPATYVHAGRLLSEPGEPPRGPTTIIVRNGLVAELRD